MEACAVDVDGVGLLTLLDEEPDASIPVFFANCGIALEYVGMTLIGEVES